MIEKLKRYTPIVNMKIYDDSHGAKLVKCDVGEAVLYRIAIVRENELIETLKNYMLACRCGAEYCDLCDNSLKLIKEIERTR